MAERIIILGSNAQIGTELVTTRRAKHGQPDVIASDIRVLPSADESNPYE